MVLVTVSVLVFVVVVETVTGFVMVTIAVAVVVEVACTVVVFSLVVVGCIAVAVVKTGSVDDEGPGVVIALLVVWSVSGFVNGTMLPTGRDVLDCVCVCVCGFSIVCIFVLCVDVDFVVKSVKGLMIPAVNLDMVVVLEGDVCVCFAALE